MAHADIDARDRLLALLEPIHERSQLTARRLCRSAAEGDDLYQEAALRALTRMSQLRDDTAFPAWFYRILLSLHRSRARRSFWRRLIPLQEMIDAGGEPAGDNGATWEDSRRSAARMRRALASLPAVQREAVVLFEIDGYSLSEIAQMQQVSLSAVKSRLTRGRARLRRHYTRHHVDAASDAASDAAEAEWPARNRLAEKGTPS